MKTVCYTFCLLGAIAGIGMAQSLPLVQDSFVAAGSPMNYGALPTINVGGTGQYQGLVQFDLSTLPTGTTGTSVAKATLSLFVNKVGNPGAINIDVANFNWTEQGVNGTNAPTVGPVVQNGVPVTTANTYLVVDATQAVKNWLDGITPNNGFIISQSVSGVSVFFDSKENPSTSHPASLSVMLNGPAGAPGPQGATGPRGATGPQGPPGPTIIPPALSMTGLLTTVRKDDTLPRGQYMYAQVGCPFAYPNLISGGCGHRDFNDASLDLLIHYNGPAVNGSQVWSCILENAQPNPGSRQVVIFAICSK